MNFTELIEKAKAKVSFEKAIYLTDEKDSTEVDSSIEVLNAVKRVKYGNEEYMRIKEVITSYKTPVMLFTNNKYIAVANRLLWECPNLVGTFSTESEDPYAVEQTVTSGDKLLWDLQATKAEDDVALQSGWTNSYNNEKFKDEEIEEYTEDSKLKLLPYVGPDKDVLEVGIGSGMIAKKIMPYCRTYDGCDISQNVLDKLQVTLDENGITNTSLYNYGGDEIRGIGKKYDIILMSSVTEYFSGYNYLRNVVETCVDCIKDKGIVFFADVFDLDTKDDYQASVNAYAAEHPGVIYKKNFSHELFVPKAYWKDIEATMEDVAFALVTRKIGVIDNEINNYRYDAMLFVDKTKSNKAGKLNKYQLGL